jgi:hypothetical protein
LLIVTGKFSRRISSAGPKSASKGCLFYSQNKNGTGKTGAIEGEK